MRNELSIPERVVGLWDKVRTIERSRESPRFREYDRQNYYIHGVRAAIVFGYADQGAVDGAIKKALKSSKGPFVNIAEEDKIHFESGTAGISLLKVDSTSETRRDIAILRRGQMMFEYGVVETEIDFKQSIDRLSKSTLAQCDVFPLPDLLQPKEFYEQLLKQKNLSWRYPRYVDSILRDFKEGELDVVEEIIGQIDIWVNARELMGG